MEIIYGNTIDNRHQIVYDQDIIIAPDGENLALDWDSEKELKNKSSNMPIVIFLPGLTGNSTSPYIRKCIYELRDRGIRSVVFNPRGSIIAQKTRNLFNFESIYKDLDVIVSHINEKYPDSKVYLVGFSLGSSYGLRYLSKNQDKFNGMVCIANPFDVFKAAKSLNSYRNFIYS